MNATKSLKTLIPAALVLAVTVYPGSEMALWGSFALVIVTVIFLPWSVYSMVRMVRRPVASGPQGRRPPRTGRSGPCAG